MIFHKASEERKWKQWKEQEERILRESGVSEGPDHQHCASGRSLADSDHVDR